MNTAKKIALKLASDDIAGITLTEAPEQAATEEVSADEIRKELHKLSDKLYDEAHEGAKWKLQLRMGDSWHTCRQRTGQRLSNPDWYRWKHPDGHTKPVEVTEDGRLLPFTPETREAP